MSYSPTNIYSKYVKAYIYYAEDGNLEKIRSKLTNVFKQDTTRLDVLQELAKICYYQKDYKSAYQYYQPFVEIRKAYHLEIYRNEDLKIGRVFLENGFPDEAQELFDNFREYVQTDKTIYQNLEWAFYYAQMGNQEKALDYLRLFSEEEHFHYWTIVFTPIEPVMESLVKHPEFQQIMKNLEQKFQNYHNRIKKSLKEKSLI